MVLISGFLFFLSMKSLYVLLTNEGTGKEVKMLTKKNKININ